jgi:diacylglycerol kinase family enzyme
MRWSPDARLDDGFADLLLVEPVRWIRIPAYVPLLFKGRIHRIPEARSFRSDSVQAEFGHAACFEMDGEVFRGVALTIEVVPKALRVLAG